MSSALVTAVSSQVKRVRLFFDQASDEQFLVLAEILAPAGLGALSAFHLSTYEHEDRFLERVVTANLTVSNTSQVASTILLTVADPYRSKNWVELDLDQEQRHELGLNDVDISEVQTFSLPVELGGTVLSSNLVDGTTQLHDFLMKAPAAFVMLSGPEHRLTLMNDRYLDLLGESSTQDLHNRPMREVLPELEGQVFFKLLDEVYRTGVPHVGVETLAHMRRKGSHKFEDIYLDFIYHPFKDRHGVVCGIMVQATDVTERVEGREGIEDREEQMFRQWAELDSIYRAAPIAMALLDAKSFRILRLNQRQAELMGATVPQLLGRSVLKLATSAPALAKLFENLAAGEAVRNAIFEKEPQAGSADHRTWLINISPFFGAKGEIIAYTSMSLELPDEPPTRLISSDYNAAVAS